MLDMFGSLFIYRYILVWFANILSSIALSYLRGLILFGFEYYNATKALVPSSLTCVTSATIITIFSTSRLLLKYFSSTLRVYKALDPIYSIPLGCITVALF